MIYAMMKTLTNKIIYAKAKEIALGLESAVKVPQTGRDIQIPSSDTVHKMADKKSNSYTKCAELTTRHPNDSKRILCTTSVSKQAT